MNRWDDSLASRAIVQVGTVSDATFAKYRSRVVEMATMLQLSGTAATLAFLASRPDPAHQLAGEHLAHELAPLVAMPPPEVNASAVAKAILDLSVDDRIMMERHARTYAGWMKRAVEIRRQRAETKNAAVA